MLSNVYNYLANVFVYTLRMAPAKAFRTSGGTKANKKCIPKPTKLAFPWKSMGNAIRSGSRSLARSPNHRIGGAASQILCKQMWTRSIAFAKSRSVAHLLASCFSASVKTIRSLVVRLFELLATGEFMSSSRSSTIFSKKKSRRMNIKRRLACFGTLKSANKVRKAKKMHLA